MSFSRLRTGRGASPVGRRAIVLRTGRCDESLWLHTLGVQVIPNAYNAYNPLRYVLESLSSSHECVRVVARASTAFLLSR